MGSGRDGQIRTADLSLRRRPLYPSELRPRTNFIVTSEPLRANIAPVMHALEVDHLTPGIRALNRFSQIDAGGSYAEHAAPRGLQAAGAQLGPSVKPRRA